MLKNIYSYPLTLFLLLIDKKLFAASSEATLTSAGIRMFWGLLVVLGILLIIYGIARKRLSPVYTNAKSKIKILEMRHLMPKKSLCLVEVSGKEYLLGLGSDTITLLSTPDVKEKKHFSTTLDSAAEQNEQKIL